ncbi:hypothetical protein R1T16_01805 [Flavobacterium sp. DG1-102-2]|uniref:hypothetical protein n=1 Tax=Flavobacterium sp. DG1-102-2 TaxID=3081663 RepID=UPI002948F8A9|nr:hypothetical protein [Flavobacterium sp. DG1-102-2]MDV6167140.1 hypothetical protein [Flavobacterium sp. DG1-102-2]
MKSIAAICILTMIVVTSCSYCEDDSATNNGIAVQYRINVDEPIIAEVQYRNSQDQIIVINISGQNDTMWHRTEFVSSPFQAYKSVKFLNVSNKSIDYTLRLFVDGTLVHTKAGSVLPESESAEQVQYSILD